MRKKTVFIFLSLVVIGYFSFLIGIHLLNDKFLLSHVVTSKESGVQCYPTIGKEELQKVLSKPFFYLNQGSQVYAFVSEDGNYVLKLIKQNRLRYILLPSFKLLPSFLQKMQQEKKQEKIEKKKKLYNSLQIAWNELRNECGLVYMGLNSNTDFDFKITLFDKLGRKKTLSLNAAHFLLQKKGQLIAPTLQTLITSGKLEEAKKRIDEIYQLLLLRCQKGIFDSDASLAKNAGYLEDKAIYLDLGGFSKNNKIKNPLVYILEIEKISHRLTQWLQSQNKEMASYSNEWLKSKDVG